MKGAVEVAVMIGLDPHKRSHTAHAVNQREERLGGRAPWSGGK